MIFQTTNKLSQFFTRIYNALCVHINWEVVRCLLIGELLHPLYLIPLPYTRISLSPEHPAGGLYDEPGCGDEQQRGLLALLPSHIPFMCYPIVQVGRGQVLTPHRDKMILGKPHHIISYPTTSYPTLPHHILPYHDLVHSSGGFKRNVGEVMVDEVRYRK